MATTSAPKQGNHPRVRRFFARDLPSAATQVALVASLFLLYREGRLLSGEHVSTAVRNGSNLWHLERTLHLPSEESLQQLVLDRHEIVRAANWYYVGAHFPVTIIFLCALFLWRRALYNRVRNALIVATALGLGIHIVYPLAPPRLVSGIDMVDTGTVFGPSPYRGAVRGAANQFAAMPSLHVGWAVLIGVVLWRVAPLALRWLGALHATLTTLVVVVTANHYWIDGVVGAGIVLVALRITRPWAAREPSQVSDEMETSPLLAGS
jgi:hypothetical protein